MRFTELLPVLASVASLLRPAGAEEPSREKAAPSSATWRLARLPPGAIAPERLKYEGAFAAPPEGRGVFSWAYSPGALTYCPGGTPTARTTATPAPCSARGTPPGGACRSWPSRRRRSPGARTLPS